MFNPVSLSISIALYKLFFVMLYDSQNCLYCISKVLGSQTLNNTNNDGASSQSSPPSSPPSDSSS